MFNLEKSMPVATRNLFLTMAEIEEISKWTLVGGTALSLRLAHRTSEDLDFFVKKNFINNQSKRDIDKIISSLSKKGFLSEVTLFDENQINFDISGVKVTFHAMSGYIGLDDCDNFKNIRIASLETIAAMKMHTILKYRIKSRDFYDVKFLIEHKYDFKSLVAIYKAKINPKDLSEKIIQQRFLKTKQNIDDEGFDAIELHQNQKDKTFKNLRDFFAKKFENILKNDFFIFSEIKKTPDNISSDLSSYRFGLISRTLLVECLQNEDYDLYEQILNKKIMHPLIESLDNKSSLYLLAEAGKKELFSATLFQCNSIPPDLKKNIEILGDKNSFLQEIEYHRLLNRCIGKEKEVVSSIFKSSSFFGKISMEKFHEDIKEKKKQVFILQMNTQKNQSSFVADMCEVDEKHTPSKP